VTARAEIPRPRASSSLGEGELEFRHPLLRSAADHARAGRREEAGALVRELAAAADATGSGWARAAVAPRGRGQRARAELRATIEYHLGRIHRKLDVRGRAQLARLMAMALPEGERDPAVPADALS
jgi:hypothetical protein